MGLLLLTAIHLGCTWVMKSLGLPLPGSLVGLLACAALIHLGVIPLGWVDGAASLLLRHLVVLFLPLSASLWQFWPLLRDSGLGLLPTVVISTGLVLIASGLVAEKMARGDTAAKEGAHADAAP